MKDRIKSAGFWTGILGALFLILGSFGVEVGGDTANTVVNAVCSFLVMLGIITPVPNSKKPDCDGDGDGDCDGDCDCDDCDGDGDDCDGDGDV